MKYMPETRKPRAARLATCVRGSRAASKVQGFLRD